LQNFVLPVERGSKEGGEGKKKKGQCAIQLQPDFLVAVRGACKEGKRVTCPANIYKSGHGRSGGEGKGKKKKKKGEGGKSPSLLYPFSLTTGPTRTSRGKKQEEKGEKKKGGKVLSARSQK